MQSIAPLVREASPSDLVHLEGLWKALYRHQAEHGMTIALPVNAFDAWVDGLRSVLGRFAGVIVAESADELVGFVCGRVRMLPPHFGLQQVGFVGEVFVSQQHRSTGTGRRMLDAMVGWFRDRSIRRVELQVVTRNQRALTFYERLGWKQELVQLTLDTHSAPQERGE